ncbi:hypothetical protein, partial [Caldisericum sp.]|uniref:hypothetical protein n=1 Tax=Caldisericum sp. TaxID=2499687 RepID=UPI003D13CCB0
MKPGVPAQLKPNIPAKTYWCAEVKDILFSKEPQQGQKLSVGVRVKFRKMTIIPGAPGPKLCNCAFEGPSGNLAKVWTKTMSLRLIGIKYSETETNLLEYYGPTPAFVPYTYSGFQVIGFTVTEGDLKEGVKDIWGWASKEPLQCRDAKIYATLDVNGYALKGDNDPDYLKKGCFPSGDFVKSFKPKCLQVPKIPEGAIKEGAKKAETSIESGSSAETKTLPKLPEAAYSSKKILRIPAEKLVIEKKLPPIKFIPLDRSYFKIPVDQKTITLKEKTIMVNGKPLLVRKAKTISVEQFLKEVNDIEEWLNGLGYTLKDKEPIKIKYVYPREQFKLQREMLSKDFLKKVTIPLPPQVTCEGYSEGYDSSTGGPKDFVPLDWERNWDASFGNEDFGVNLAASMKIKGEEDTIDIEPLFNATISFFGDKSDVLKIYKRKGDNTLIGEVMGKRFFTQPIYGTVGKTFTTDFKGTPIDIELSLFDLFTIYATFGWEGNITTNISGQFEKAFATEKLDSKINAKSFGEAKADLEIVSVGVDASLALVDNYVANINANAQLAGSTNKNFVLSTSGKHKGNFFKGKLLIFGEIDYLVGSKKFEIDIFHFDGFGFESDMFPPYYKSIPAERDHHVWLKINKIAG